MTTDPKARGLPNMALMTPIQDYLKEKAADNQLEYTIFSTGIFLDLFLEFPFLLDLQNRSIELFDEGKHPFSLTSVAGIGAAVAGALKLPEATKNRNLFVHEAILTQGQVYALAKKYSPPGIEWAETQFDAGKELEKHIAAAQKDIKDPLLILPLLKATLLSGRYTSAYSQVDNELVGLRMLSDDVAETRLAYKFADI